jgi:hypothetical protein
MDRDGQAWRGRVALAVLVFAGSWGGAAGALAQEARTVTVDCGAGETIAGALRGGPATRPLVVVVRGSCTEHVVVTRDDVTLRGEGASLTGDGSADLIRVDGARRVTVESFALSGGRNGLAAARGASVIVRDSTIRAAGGAPFAGGNGIRVHQGSQALVHGNLIEDHPGSGVVVEDGSQATITANTIRANRGDGGIVIARNSTARIGLTDDDQPAGNLIEQHPVDGIGLGAASSALLHGNTVRGNGFGGNGEGILVHQESTLRLAGGNRIEGNTLGIFLRDGNLRTSRRAGMPPGGDVVTANTGAGISAFHNSSLDLRGGGGDVLTISGNGVNGIFLFEGAVLEMRQTTVTGNGRDGIQVAGGSRARLLAGNQVTANGSAGIRCFGDDSRISGDFSGVTANPEGNLLCPGFF